MTVGFIGFGEAASSIAAGLHEEGLKDIICFDAMQKDERFSPRMTEKVRACDGIQKETSVDVCREADVIIAAVQSNFAVEAAKECVSGLSAGKLYIDVSTATPKEKKEIDAMVEAQGARFVDGAMMGALLKDRHKVQTLISGKGAREYQEKMEPYHMRLEYVGEEPGTATAMKFMRSITAKGLSCLLIESLEAAQHFGVEDTIVDSLLDTFGSEFEKIIDGYVSGAILHANRREHELQNVVDFLKSEGLPSTMAEATRQKLAWLDEEKIKDRFSDGVPRKWKAVLAGWK